MNLETVADAPAASLDTLFLHAGQVIATSNDPRLVHTIVGSCVAVCIWHPVRRLAGINHFVLPTRPSTSQIAGRPLSYGEVAIPELLARLISLGAEEASLEAKVFGGAQLAGDARSAPLGARNVHFAFDLLSARGVRVVAHDVGGLRGRKLVFDPRDGSVLVKLL